jgi:hypothetical protein
LAIIKVSTGTPVSRERFLHQAQVRRDEQVTGMLGFPVGTVTHQEEQGVLFVSGQLWGELHACHGFPYRRLQ